MLRRVWMTAGLTAGSLALAAPVAQAATVSIIGVQTEVEVTAPLAALGLTGAPYGTATADVTGANPIFAFPITGGTLDTLSGAALIQHQGSGVTLSGGGASATVGNFVIDTAATQVLGDVIDAMTGTSVASGLQLFTFGTGVDLPGVELLISGTLAGALTATFGAQDLTGAAFGYARPEVATVPLPAAGWLLVAGLGALGTAAAHRRRAA